MSIIRGKRPESNWYTLDKKTSEDKRLSWAARGLLVFLLGKPDDWNVSIEHLRKQTLDARIKTARDGVYALLKELETTGYIRVVQGRSKNGRGFGEVDYIVSETVLPPEPVAQSHVHTACVVTPDADTPEPTLVSTEEATRIDRKTRRSPSAALDFEVPDWINRAAWDGFVESRKRNPMTPRAAELVIQELAKLRVDGHDPTEVLDQSTRNGWRDVFPLKNKREQSHAAPGKLSAVDRIQANIDAARAADGPRKLSTSDRTRAAIAARHAREAASGVNFIGAAFEIVL